MADSVSALPPPPDTAAAVFGNRVDLACRFAELLATDGVLRGLIGPREAPRLWERHLLNCAVLADGIEAGAHVADLGSGAGLPGVVLALRRPDLHLTLVEPLSRRTSFLDEAVLRLDLNERVQVVRGRAESLAGVRSFDVVTARALAPLPRLLGWAMPLVAPGGSLLAVKGRSAEQEISTARAELRRFGAGEVGVETYGDGVVDEPTTVVRVRKA